MFRNLLIISLLVQSIYQQKVIQATYFRIQGDLSLQIFLGIPQVEATIVIDLSQDHSFLDSILHLSSLSIQGITPKTIFHSTFKKNIEITVQEIFDIIEFKYTNTTSHAYFSYYATDSKNEIKSKLGMGAKFNDTTFSIIHQLKQYNFIDYLSFAFHPLDIHSINAPQFGIPYSNGKMIIGDIPIIQEDNYGFCKINSTQSKWSCKLKSISIGNSFIYVNNDDTISYFQSNTFRINTPKDFMLFLKNKVFHDYINRDICEFQFLDTEYLYTFDLIKCNCQYVSEMPMMSFTFGNFVFSIKMSSLFLHSGKFCESLFVSYNKDEWVFGTAFVDKYITMFDYEREDVIFYTFPLGGIIQEVGNKSQYMKISNNHHMSLYCFVIACILNLIGIILDIIIKYKNKI